MIYPFLRAMNKPQKPENADYRRVGHLLRTGFIKHLNEIFDTGVRKAILGEMKMSYKTLGRRLDDPSSFKIRELQVMVERFKVDRNIIIDLVWQAADPKKNRGKN